MSATDIVNAILNNEPAEAVDHFQEMVKDRSRVMVMDRYWPQPEAVEPIEENAVVEAK